MPFGSGHRRAELAHAHHQFFERNAVGIDAPHDVAHVAPRSRWLRSLMPNKEAAALPHHPLAFLRHAGGVMLMLLSKSCRYRRAYRG